MKFIPSFSATAAAALCCLLLAASPRRAVALVPGTPLDGANDGVELIVVGTIAPEGGGPYIDFADLNGADRAVPGDVVILAQVTGNTAVDDNPSNWLAVARFFSPADPDGSKGLDATQEIGFLSTDAPLGPATDFSKFTLFPNVFYSPVGSTLPGVAGTLITEFGPAGEITFHQTALIEVTVDGIGTPEPATAALLVIATPLLLSRRRRALRCLAQNA